ncbi:hypothetical protein JD292_04955 [Leucobacter sp. CSA2]|uniref:Uncharacterized protein n=1 Tax=Leucobacter edaphi TaxID=2796472 RepID=A0A934QBA1_9MICO|nr:hypothetical protein [Leucobacter edaphi]MBK0421421.1 hypothetical protein [Leucobacter edaphi]
MLVNPLTTRRHATRVTATLTAALTLVAGLGVGAPAANAQAEQTEVRTVTANLYVGAKDTPIRRNAYVTNPATPPFNYPDSPMKNNAKLEVKADGTRLLTIPIVNNTFGVVSLPHSSIDGTVDVVSIGTTRWSTVNGPAQRVSTVTLDVTRLGTGAARTSFSPATEYANFFLYRGYKNWDLNLEFSS